ncbi:MAG: hypothetical protein LBT64_02645 [Puniceicoccales bacterium]|nr:hypothetical protein [Puniceicoccales bacterium]
MNPSNNCAKNVPNLNHSVAKVQNVERSMAADNKPTSAGIEDDYQEIFQWKHFNLFCFQDTGAPVKSLDVGYAKEVENFQPTANGN